MKCDTLHGPWLPECLGCDDEIPLKRLTARPYSTYCVACQSHRDKYMEPPAHVMAALSEEDDNVRVREEAWANV